jgi:protocatechuate 3,4-dioxygenase beta subunit
MTTTVSSDSAASTQAEVSREIADISAAYQASGLEETQPRLDYAPYRSSLLRHPTRRPSSSGRRASGSAT